MAVRWIAAVPLLLAAAAMLAACGSAGTAPAEPPVRERPQQAARPLEIASSERPYLIGPLTGYPQEQQVDSERREAVLTAYRRLLEAGDVEGAERTAAELLEGAPDFHPAQVLAAQIDFLENDFQAVFDRLKPLEQAVPGYVASQLLLGRAAEKLGNLPEAYSAYRAIAARQQLAFQRTGELHPRALEILYNRVNDALRSADLVVAEESLARLQAWAPSELVTLEAARNVAVARADLPAELVAVKSLVARRPDDRDLLERRAELELSVGDPGKGVEIIQNLAARQPNDPRLAEKLESAKFRWRLTLLPQAVQQTAAKPELNRADFAVLLYWLVPNVRYGRPTAGRIATDILDHPRQEEIVRVVNLGLMDVDPTLHRFSPGGSVRQGLALRILVRLLGQFGQGIPCMGGAAGKSACDVATQCGLISGEGGCQTQAPLSGAEAVDMIRRSLDLLGAS